jgi:hypothetical protein
MNFSRITNSSDVVDYSGDIVGPLEFNCSQYEFGKEPPNVTQHFDGIIVQKFISINRFKLSLIIYKWISYFQRWESSVSDLLMEGRPVRACSHLSFWSKFVLTLGNVRGNGNDRSVGSVKKKNPVNFIIILTILDGWLLFVITHLCDYSFHADDHFVALTDVLSSPTGR